MMAESGRSLSKMSEETYDYICNGCDKKNKTLQAVKYCLQCKVYCCQSCVDMHEIFPPLAGHSFEDVGQGNQSGNQQSSVHVSEFPTERCSKHAGKVIDMYCQKHDEVGCCTCMASSHKSCPESQIFSVPDTIGQLFNLTDSKKIQSRIQQMMIAMTTLHESKTSRLESLKEAKTKAIDQITEFENALKVMLHKAAENSKKKVEEEIMKQEDALLQDIHSIDVTKTKLKETDDKLTKAASNRAQKFVCSKEAELKFKEAENEKKKQESDDKTDVSVSFRPNLELMDYIQGLQGIGDVLVNKKERSDIYKVKSSRDINIRVSDDTETCCSFGSCLTHDDKLIITDVGNKKLKRIDTSTMAVDSCILDGHPLGICRINQTDEVCVGCRDPNKIQFVSLGDKMKPTIKIDTSHVCYGIAMKDDHLYVTDGKNSLYVYDMNGTLLRTIINDNDGNKLFSTIRHIAFNESGDKMFVGDGSKGLVCFDGAHNYLTTIKDNDLKEEVGVCTDGGGNVLVAGFSSNNIVQFNEDGKKIGVVVTQKDGLKGPVAISFHQGHNRLYVTMYNSDTIKMYELE